MKKGPKPPIRILNNFFWGPNTKIAKIFKKFLGKKKNLNFIDLAYNFLHSKMKIEHIYLVLATRIINFHLFLQTIFDLEVWTRFPNFPIFFTVTFSVNFGPRAISPVLG